MPRIRFSALADLSEAGKKFPEPGHKFPEPGTRLPDPVGANGKPGAEPAWRIR